MHLSLIYSTNQKKRYGEDEEVWEFSSSLRKGRQNEHLRLFSKLLFAGLFSVKRQSPWGGRGGYKEKGFLNEMEVTGMSTHYRCTRREDDKEGAEDADGRDDVAAV